MSIVDVALMSIVDVAKIIIRPPRSEYRDEDFTDIEVNGKGTGIKISVANPNKVEMPGTLFMAPTPAPGNPVLIFSHGNAMNQYDSLDFMDFTVFVESGISVCVFDFGGCGMAKEEFITMGYREKDELGCVIDFLKSTYGFNQIILYGLSMGGFTTTLTMSERSDVTCGIVDCAYSSVGDFLKQRTAKYQAAREYIQEKMGFDIETVDAVEASKKITAPVLFIGGKNDRVCPMEMGKKIFEACSSPDKHWLEFPGGHVTPRGLNATDTIYKFIEERIGVQIERPAYFKKYLNK